MPHTQRELPRLAFLVAAFLFIVYSVVYAQGVYDGPNLEASDDSARQMPIPANPKLPTLFLIGDSTVRNGQGNGANGQWGWGEPLVNDFNLKKINVVNRALGGRSSRTYLTQGHWGLVKNMPKRGDFVMMQFGHNDGGPLDDTARARGTLPGIGDETREIDNPITKQREIVHTLAGI
jgi:lysophospholipase L1-like esterase